MDYKMKNVLLLLILFIALATTKRGEPVSDNNDKPSRTCLL